MITEGGQQFTTFVFGRRFQCFPKRGLFREIDLETRRQMLKWHHSRQPQKCIARFCHWKRVRGLLGGLLNQFTEWAMRRWQKKNASSRSQRVTHISHTNGFHPSACIIRSVPFALNSPFDGSKNMNANKSGAGIFPLALCILNILIINSSSVIFENIFPSKAINVMFILRSFLHSRINPDRK